LATGVVADFGDAAAELAAAANQTVVADLSQYGLIGLAGEDAQTFLHGQITNDLRNLNENAAVFAGYLSAKGRMLANFLVMKRAGELLVMLPEALREPIQKRLSMFILRSKVKARDAGGEWVRLGVNGPAAEAALASALGYALPEGLMGMAQGEQSFVLRLGDQRFDVFVQPDAAVALWQALCGQCRPVGAPAWDWLMVQAGVPMVLPQTQDHFVPQMANMEILGGVSFNKGCYPGQEIVARSQYLGKVKRRLFLAHVDANCKRRRRTVQRRSAGPVRRPYRQRGTGPERRFRRAGRGAQLKRRSRRRAPESARRLAPGVPPLALPGKLICPATSSGIACKHDDRDTETAIRSMMSAWPAVPGSAGAC
jgi:folate-binding protein YgfZ